MIGKKAPLFNDQGNWESFIKETKLGGKILGDPNGISDTEFKYFISFAHGSGLTALIPISISTNHIGITHINEETSAVQFLNKTYRYI